VCDKDELIETAKNHVFTQYDFVDNTNLGDITRLEGYLAPDTYEFFEGESGEMALSRLLDNFAVWMNAEVRQAINESPYTLHEIVVMASLIEKEAIGDDEERKNIGSVLYNRIENPDFETYGLLQLDSTIYYVLRTTGQDDSEKAEIKAAAEKIPVFFSANMSLGVATLVNLAKQTAALFPNADIEIVEQHHNRKLDAPSGTALMIAEALCEVRPDAEIVEGRAGQHKREKNEIGIHALRMANIVGIHEVYVTSDSEQIMLKHTAFDRALFADGAIKAAEFLVGKEAGIYTMKNIFND
jgi:hypothetical protein